LKSLLIFSAAMTVLFAIVLLLGEMVINHEFTDVEINKIFQNAELVANAELTSARPLHVQASKTIRIFLIGLASSAGILLFLVWYLLDSNVIHPVQRLAARLAEASAEGRLPSDLGLRGGDELAMLARQIEDLAITLEHTEASYRAIVEDQTDFIFRYQPDGRITFVNEALCRYFGRSRDELLGSNIRSFVADEDASVVSKALACLSVDVPIITLDHRVNLPGDGVAWFHRIDHAIFSHAGQLRELQCVARDFTQIRLTRERLEASENKYRRLFETATDGILIVRQSSRTIADANPELCHLLDCERSALVELSVESVPSFRKPKTLRALDKLLGGTQPLRETEITLLRDDGDQRFLEVRASIYDAVGDTMVQLNFRDISKRKRADNELRHLSGHLLRSQDEERRRIARELHDSTAQNLSALQLAVTHLDASVPETHIRARANLDEIRTLTDLSVKEIRTISYLLHPPLLDEVGLPFALRWYVDGFMSRTEKIVRLDVDDSLERLPPEIETTIFRVVQEGLTNIHRHSGSRRAWIRLTLENGVLTLEIRDEGHGMTPGPTGPYPRGYPVVGVGIAGMRERLHQFNGSLEIESGLRGTTLRATLPLELDESQDN
jgi:two-component system NarL family sensor kinase